MLDYSSMTDAVTGASIDPEFVQRMINRDRLGEPVKISGAVNVVDTNLQPAPMNIPGARTTGDLARMVYPTSATVTTDVTQAVQRKLSFTMKDPLELGVDLEFDPWNHLIQPSMRMRCQGKTVDFPLGTYTMDSPQATISRRRRTFQWDGLDVTAFLALTDLLSDYTIVANYTGGYLQAIQDLFMVGSIPKSLSGTGQTPQGNDDAGPAWPASVFEVDPSGNQTVAIPMIGRAGTNRVAFGADLAGAVNYFPLHMTNSTTMRLKRIPDYTVSPPAVSWDYSTTGSSIVTGSIQQIFDHQSDACNVVRLEGGQANAQGGSTFASTQINNDPNSKVSYQNLKTLFGQPRAIGKYVSDSLIANQSMATLKAKLILLIGSTLHERATFTTLPNPLTENYEYYVFNVTWNNGQVMISSTASTSFLEVGWTLPFLSPKSRMQHILVRAGGI